MVKLNKPDTDPVSERPTSRVRVSVDETHDKVGECLLAVLKIQQTATTDDVHDRLDIDPLACKQIGIAIHHLARQQIIQFVEYRRSRRVASHGRVISVWTLAQQH